MLNHQTEVKENVIYATAINPMWSRSSSIITFLRPPSFRDLCPHTLAWASSMHSQFTCMKPWSW